MLRGQLGFEPSKDIGTHIFPELYRTKSDYIRKYTPAQLLFILSKELGGSSFLNN